MREQRSITVVADIKEDQEILNLLGFSYTISEIISYADMLNKILERDMDSDRPMVKPDFIIINGTDISLEVYTRYRGTFFTMPIETKFLAFGKNSFALGDLNGCNIFTEVTNHKEPHSVSFCMPDSKILEFTVPSNHDKLIVPKRNSNYSILAFSSYNMSNSYTTNKGEVIKAKRNFIEIEGIYLADTHSYCFLYDVPTTDNSVLLDLTLQFINN